MFNVFGVHHTRSTWKKAVIWIVLLMVLGFWAWLVNGFTFLGTLNLIFAVLWACTLGYQLVNRPPKTKDWRMVDLHKSDI